MRRSLHSFIEHRLHRRRGEMRGLEIVECDADRGEPDCLADTDMIDRVRQQFVHGASTGARSACCSTVFRTLRSFEAVQGALQVQTDIR